MPPTVNDKTSPPPGLLPANIRYIVLAAIAALILITSFFSGHAPKKTGDGLSGLPAGPNQNQLTLFTQMLERQRREAEDAKKQAEAMRLAEEQSRVLAARIPAPYSAPEPQRVVTAPMIDPFEQKRREREETAPFAGNIALKIVPSDDAEHATRQAGTSERPPELSKPPADARSEIAMIGKIRNPGSGKYLPELDQESRLFRIYEGTFIETTLLNRLDGSFTGPVKCVVSKELRSRSGEVLLIPKGSEFFGEAKRVDSAGQTRLAVSFKRLLLPNGYSVDLENTPGLNEYGETGLKDRTNNHTLRTLGLSGAVGLLGGLALYGGHAGSVDYANGVVNAEGGAATTILSRSMNLLPTVTIREGHEVKVYLSADLQVPEYRP